MRTAWIDHGAVAHRVAICGMGVAHGSELVTNDRFVKTLDTSDEWILSRTGIKSRRFADASETTVSLALQASRLALEEAGLEPAELDLILLATASPDAIVPSGAATLQGSLGASRAVPFDLSAACCGFLFAAHTAAGLLKAGLHRTALVVGSETLSRRLNPADRSVAVLFGDGAGAAVLRRAPGLTLRYSSLGGDGRLADLIRVPNVTPVRGEGQPVWLTVDGSKVFKIAVRRMADEILGAIAALELDVVDIHRIVPHQANQRIIDAVAEAIGADATRVYSCVRNLGNTSAASVPIAMARSFRERPLRVGERVLTVAFGGGATWGCQVWERTWKSPRWRGPDDPRGQSC